MVYLTTAYPFYFATGSENKIAVVYEIDAHHLDEVRLYPDEDFVTLLARDRRGKELTKGQSRHVRNNLDLFQNMWRKSLVMLGNCAYRGTVPAKAITRYCLFNSAARPELTFHCMDASINMLNYQFEGGNYGKVVAWFFGDRKLLPMVDQAETTEERDFWLAQSKDRTEIEVVNMQA